MRGHELGIQKREPAPAQARHQMHQGDLRGIPFRVEHALAEEGPVEPHTIATTDEAAVPVDLHPVAVARIEEFAVEFANAPADPGLLPIHSGSGAAGDDPVEIPIDPDL